MKDLIEPTAIPVEPSDSEVVVETPTGNGIRKLLFILLAGAGTVIVSLLIVVFAQDRNRVSDLELRAAAHASLEGHPVLVERMESITRQLDIIERKIDDLRNE